MSHKTLRLALILCVLATLVVAATLLSPSPSTRATSAVAAVSAGYDHTCALATTGGLRCWGRNGFGQLGDGTTTERHTPADVSGLTSGVAAADGGLFHTCAFTTAGGLKCWGSNDVGQLGNGNAPNQSKTPVDVSGLTSDVAAVSVGAFHSCALTTAGGLKCWGDNLEGKVGDGTTTDRHTPVDVVGLLSGVAAVTAGTFHTCALTTAGGLKCWGSNRYGQLGDGTKTDRDTPVDVSGLTSGVAAVSAGGNHTCALTTAGGVKCWGKNDLGQLGDATTTHRHNPVDVSGLTSDVAAVSVGAFHSCALITAGGLKCWGRNDFGQLGDVTTTDRHTPVDVFGLTSGVAAVSGGLFHTCALTTTGEAKCWGRNISGQLGDGTTTARSTPADVVTDSDRDGCEDAQELGSDQTVGGQRNPKYHWDFFDVWTGLPAGRDGAVSVSDIGAVIARFGATRDPVPTKESALAEALTLPPLAPAYHTAFDRGGPLPGQSLWNLRPPDGSINIVDIGSVVAQFGHSCV